MNDDPFINRRPTEIEDQAHVQAVRHFAEHLKQFPISRGAISQLEGDLSKTALAANMAASRPVSPGNSIQTDDGAQWHKSVDLFDHLFVCHRSTPTGTEYAVVEHFPANGRNEIWTRGHNAVEVLKRFTHDQRQALQVWTEDTAAQVKEFLAEKYPGQDMSRVADAFIHKLTTQEVSQQQTITHGHQQKHGYGMGV
ncbi:MAG: hypothetical protein ABSA69_08365 [Verrucomicrobiota bacterium]|jgi:hypothetical protein